MKGEDLNISPSKIIRDIEAHRLHLLDKTLARVFRSEEIYRTTLFQGSPDDPLVSTLFPVSFSPSIRFRDPSGIPSAIFLSSSPYRWRELLSCLPSGHSSLPCKSPAGNFIPRVFPNSPHSSIVKITIPHQNQTGYFFIR